MSCSYLKQSSFKFSFYLVVRCLGKFRTSTQVIFNDRRFSNSLKSFFLRHGLGKILYIFIVSLLFSAYMLALMGYGLL